MRRVFILRQLHERLLQSTGLSRCLIYGLPLGYGNLDSPVAITVINYVKDEFLTAAKNYLPHGLQLIGVVEYDEDEDQEVYAALDNIEHPILLKVAEEKIVCSTGLDFLTLVNLDVISGDELWNKRVITFRLKGQLLLNSLLEIPDLKQCFEKAKMSILKQATYSLGTKSPTILLPPSGKMVNGKVSSVSDLVKQVAGDHKEKFVFTPPTTIVNTKILFNQTKCSSLNSAVVVIADKSASCKYFEHYLDLDVLVLVPISMSILELYDRFNAAICNQLELGFHANIIQQLENSISAEKPKVFHFWPNFAEHFVTVLYPENISEEKLKDIRHELHKLFFIREMRPYFRQSASLFQPIVGLVSPHVSLTGKFSETEFIKGEYEYRHYMQEGFNDDGWGCAYRSLQSIISWFRLQGFTSVKVPTHREIQECLVSIGDKPGSFVGSKQWIGSTEVSFVLETLLGISCRIISLSSGGEMASRVSELQSHFRIHGTPVMIGGGVLAHTIIGASSDPDSDTDVNYLVLDPHYTGKDDLKTILSKGWVGWKDNNFWSKKDFYNMCMPLLPASI